MPTLNPAALRAAVVQIAPAHLPAHRPHTDRQPDTDRRPPHPALAGHTDTGAPASRS
ncbi:hypothetical protein GUY61_05405 [Streptomyces sp. GC420]|nr:hypothetical protein [Streptomyces sp. GC420]